MNRRSFLRLLGLAPESEAPFVYNPYCSLYVTAPMTHMSGFVQELGDTSNGATVHPDFELATWEIVGVKNHA